MKNVRYIPIIPCLKFFVSSLFLLLGLFPTLLHAQALSCRENTDSFSVSQTIGCDSVITVTNTIQGARSIGYYFHFEGNYNDTTSYVQADASGSATYTYKAPGTYKIVQIGTVDGEGFAYCSDIQIINTSSPIAKVYACGSQDVTIEFIDFEINTQYDRLGIIWGDGTPIEYITKGEVLTKKHTYSNRGSYPISAFGEYNGTNCSRGRTLELGVYEIGQDYSLDELQLHKLEVQSDDALEITTTNRLSFTVIIETQGYTENDFSKTTIQTSAPGSQILKIPTNTLPLENIRIRHEDYCNNAYIGSGATIVHIKATSQGEENIIEWNKNDYPSQFIRYEVYKNNQLLATISSIETTTYTDSSIACGETNVYKVVAYQRHLKVVESHSKSITLSGNQTSTQSPSELIVNVLDPSTISLETQLATDLPSTYAFTIEKVEKGIITNHETLTNTTTYIDEAVNTSTQQYCYQVAYINSCDSQSDFSATACSILLSLHETTLHWTPDLPFLNQDVTWFLEKTLKNQVIAVPLSSLTNYSIENDLKIDDQPHYRIIARNNNGQEAFSNQIIYQRAPTLYVPTAFSPNNDQHNDIFLPVGQVYDQFKMTIFNRWGKPIYATYDPLKGWDGTIDNMIAPQGNYSYDIEIKKDDKTIFRKSGTFLLIR